MLTDHGSLLFGSLLLFLFFLHRTLRVKQNWQALGSLPAHSVLVAPLEILNRILPRVPGIAYGAEWSWKNVYERQPLPKVQFPYLADHIPYILSRCLRGIQLRHYSNPVTVPVQQPTTHNCGCYSC